MKIYEEQRLFNFTFWGGAISAAELLTEDEFDKIEQTLADIYGDDYCYEDTFINDLFSFETDFIAQCLGYTDFETMLDERR